MDIDRQEFTVKTFPPSALPLDCGLVVRSPDGDRLACVRPIPDTGCTGIWTSIVQSVELELVMMRQQFQAISLLNWSSDGSQLAFVSCEGLPPGKNHQLWIVDTELDGIVAPRLVYNARGLLTAVFWSPDNSLLAVADGNAGVIACPADGERVISVSGDAMRYPLSSNCMVWVGPNQLAYMNLSSDASGLWIADLATNESRRVLSLGTDEVAIPAWTGEQIWGALRGRLREPAEECTLYVWPSLQDDPAVYPLPQVTFDPATSLHPSRDGHLWAFTTWDSGRRSTRVVSLPSGATQQIELTGAAGELIGWNDEPYHLLVSTFSPSSPSFGVSGTDVGQLGGEAIVSGNTDRGRGE